MTTEQKTLLALIPAAYLLGAVPFGLLVGLARGVDVRTAGSGNIGASNVGRLLGGKFFALVLLLDLMKGLLPMLAAGFAVHFRASDAATSGLWLLVGFAGILGHMFSVFLKFKGGKGVATSTGVVLGLWPYYTVAGGIALIVFILAFLKTRIISVGSILSAISFPIAYMALDLLLRHEGMRARWPLLAFAILIAVLIVYKHRGNLARLRAGTEPRFTRRKPSTNGDGIAHESSVESEDGRDMN
jgi:glycerol-3-phosphate acyltransferase PlsY